MSAKKLQAIKIRLRAEVRAIVMAEIKPREFPRDEMLRDWRETLRHV